jgi:hypothetical protein
VLCKRATVGVGLLSRVNVVINSSRQDYIDCLRIVGCGAISPSICSYSHSTLYG